MVAVIVGLVLWTIYVVGAGHPGSLGLTNLDPFASLSLPPIGLLLVITGTGTLLSFRAWSGFAATHEQPVEPDVQDARLLDRNTKPIPEINYPMTSQQSNSQLGVMVFVESILVILLYAGVLDEYQANVSMQNWVLLTIPLIKIFLNQETLTIISGILALMIVQFLPGRRLYS